MGRACESAKSTASTTPGVVAGVTFAALLVAGGVRGSPGILVVPLETEFGWSRATISLAIGINIFLYGLSGPFAAALMERFGLRRHAGRTHDDRRRRAGNALDASTLALWAARSFSDLSAVCVRVLLWSLALRSVLWSGLDRDRAADYPPDRKYFRFGKNGNDVRVDNGDPSARRGFRRPCSAASCASAKKAGESVDARTMLRSPGGGVG